MDPIFPRLVVTGGNHSAPSGITSHSQWPLLEGGVIPHFHSSVKTVAVNVYDFSIHGFGIFSKNSLPNVSGCYTVKVYSKNDSGKALSNRPNLNYLV